ncbi:MAG: pyrG [Alphaproteobacteria bacterium]|nr:pyrG [Alphaproteobacteria bacterium]
MTRYIFITGGVVSSLGKGLATAALGAVLQAHGYSVRLRKLDPYLNVDPGTMSPTQHGEVFVTDDGAETDLDLGHYERFAGVTTNKQDNITTGRIYTNVLSRERRGDYLGATIQVVPHVTDEIQDFIKAADGTADFVLIELGGTVGDIEILPFLEAIRQFRNEIGHKRVMFAHMTLLPYISVAGEYKTKPTQHSVSELLSHGIQPNVLMCRADRVLTDGERKKIAQFCNVSPENVVSAPDAKTIYQVPITYHEEGLDRAVLNYFDLPFSKPDLSRWENIVHTVQNPEGAVTIAVVGKYVTLLDSYKSLIEALHHGGIANKTRVNLRWVDAEKLEKTGLEELQDVQGILVPGGFGERGTEGKIRAITYARENKIPYFGICFGMQMAVIEASRNLGSLPEANSSELRPENPQNVVGLMTEWLKGNELETRHETTDLGGTMRLGAYPCFLEQGSLASKIYGGAEISERHRHRYEVNINYKTNYNQAGLVFSGMSPDNKLPEIIERNDHPWFIGVQFHPELKSKPFAPHPLFKSFIAAAMKQERLV